MKRNEALIAANGIAKVLNLGVSLIKYSSIRHLPLLATLPLFKLRSDAYKKKDLDINSVSPVIFEILVYGSTVVVQNGTIKSIDMIIIDNNHFSNFIQYDILSNNLNILLNGWLGMGRVDKDYSHIPVNLHIFPAAIFRSKDVRIKILRKHKDPNFFKNCFSSILRYDKREETFVPADVEYFEKKFNADLSDLR